MTIVRIDKFPQVSGNFGGGTDAHVQEKPERTLAFHSFLAEHKVLYVHRRNVRVPERKQMLEPIVNCLNFEYVLNHTVRSMQRGWESY